MSQMESYQNDVNRLGDRVTLVLKSLEQAPGVDKELLLKAGAILGIGFAALDAAVADK